MRAAGIEAVSIDLPFLHVGAGAQTIKSASPKEAELISIQAALNRELFKSKYGMAGGSPEYYAYFNSSAPADAAPADTSASPSTPWPATPQPQWLEGE